MPTQYIEFVTKPDHATIWDKKPAHIPPHRLFEVQSGELRGYLNTGGHYQEVKLTDVWPDTTSYDLRELYVYSVENNPDGPTSGTAFGYLGTAENYTQAADLWDAAQATADALGFRPDDIALAVRVKA